MDKKKKKVAGIIGILIGFLTGAALGIGMVVYMEIIMPENLTPVQELLRMVLMLLILYASIFLQIVIHEAGHLIFGLLSGYRFVSFRVGSLQLTRTKGRLKLSRHSLTGTAGQCLMSPPDMVDGVIPVMLYNMGGALVNVITAVLFFTLFLALDRDSLFSFFSLAMGALGFLMALTNGVPMRLGAVDNDGYNALSLSKNRDAMRALWLQLKINSELSDGKRLKELPDEWFVVPNDEAMGNSLVAAIGVFASSRLLDQNEYAQAHSLISHLLSIESGLVGVHRSMLLCDRMCCEMIGENRPGLVGEMYTKELNRFMKSMKNSPSVIRTQYIHALLIEKDRMKAINILKQFEKIGKTYPYPNDIQSDWEFMEAARRKAEREVMTNG